MDVSALVVGLMVLCLGGLSTQYPQDTQAPNSATMPSDAVQCATGRGVQGSCVDRQYCDYSTYAIDLSLYAPKGYTKPCSEREACCPFSSQIQTKTDEREQKKIWDDDEQLAEEDK